LANAAGISQGEEIFLNRTGFIHEGDFSAKQTFSKAKYSNDSSCYSKKKRRIGEIFSIIFVGHLAISTRREITYVHDSAQLSIKYFKVCYYDYHYVTNNIFCYKQSSCWTVHIILIKILCNVKSRLLKTCSYKTYSSAAN